MNCDCITKVNAKLKPRNLKLSLSFLGDGLTPAVSIRAEWIAKDHAPRGRRRDQQYVFAPFCPFCGKPNTYEANIPDA